MIENVRDLTAYDPAGSGRRAVAVAVDIVMIAGSPVLLLPPSFLLLVVTALWVIPLFIMSVVGAVMMLQARRQPNGDRLSAGQLVCGLSVVRAVDDHRVVVASDAPAALRPSDSRVARARVAFWLVLTAAVGIWGTAIWVATIIPRR